MASTQNDDSSDNTSQSKRKSTTGPGKEYATLTYNSEVLNRARNAITYIASYVEDPPYTSIGELASDGMKPLLTRLEKKYNDGQPFPQVQRVPRGRPRKRSNE